MKYKILCLISFLLFTSCENKNMKFQKEYEELAESYPHRFGNGNAVTIYNINKEYILRPCHSENGFGIEIRDLSKLDIEHKVYELRSFRMDNYRSGAQYEWLNNYVHEAIDNYVNYGETFLLIQPNN